MECDLTVYLCMISVCVYVRVCMWRGGEGGTCVCVFLTKHTKDNTVCVSIKAKNYVVHIHPTPDEIAVAWCIHIHIRYSGTVWHGTRLFFIGIRILKYRFLQIKLLIIVGSLCFFVDIRHFF